MKHDKCALILGYWPILLMLQPVDAVEGHDSCLYTYSTAALFQEYQCTCHVLCNSHTQPVIADPLHVNTGFKGT